VAYIIVMALHGAFARYSMPEPFYGGLEGQVMLLHLLEC
jgi:hypothetical protein